MKILLVPLALAFGSTAFAQDDSATYSRRDLASGAGATVTAGGGVQDFTQSGMADRTDVGGSWNVRAAYGTRSFIGGEVAYIGSARSFADDDATLLSNGGEAVVRVNAPFEFDGDRGMIEPFAVGGLAASVYSVTNGDVSGFEDNDVVYAIPLGAGIGGSYDGVYLDTRVTWRPAFGNDSIGDDDALSTVEWGANIGGEF